MYICLCLGVTTTAVQQAIDAGARSTKQVAKACGAGSACGRCRHTIRTMIEATAPDPPSSKPDRLRRRWGRTLAHGRLTSGVAVCDALDDGGCFQQHLLVCWVEQRADGRAEPGFPGGGDRRR